MRWVALAVVLGLWAWAWRGYSEFMERVCEDPYQ